jgi:hypothetical protein
VFSILACFPSERPPTAVGRVKDLTVDSFITGMESIHEYKDIFGAELSFGPDQHHGSTRSFLTVVKDGRWVPVEDTAPGY